MAGLIGYLCSENISVSVGEEDWGDLLDKQLKILFPLPMNYNYDCYQ